jgi:hypothetical protein
MQQFKELEYRFLGVAYKLQFEFGFDDDLLQDIIQEMQIKIWSMPEGHKPAFYINKAKWVAINFIVLWTQKFKLKRFSNMNEHLINALLVEEKYNELWESKEQEYKNSFANGENHGRAKLTKNDIIKIWKMSASGFSIRKLAEIYKVTKTTIEDILNGKNWTHVKIDWKVKLKYFKRIKKGKNLSGEASELKAVA